MPRIFDNIDQSLLPALKETLCLLQRADFCVGYFNLRGWKAIDDYVDRWSGGPGQCCRLLVGMQRLPQEDLSAALSVFRDGNDIDNQTAIRLKKKLAEDFRRQLMVGVPTNEDERGLRRLADQIRANKVVVKLFLRHPLHAKLDLLFRPDPISPTVGYLGSSNLTFAGLSQQGELNIDVLDYDACRKLAQWFEDRWNDRWCVDISNELLAIIDESWARKETLPPYYVYLKMAYHLSQEARAGLSEFKLPRDFTKKLFEFQVAAVKIAAHHLNKRGGVLIGDVVGLGKTLMATAVARIFEDDHDLETLVICPKNLVPMWEDYRAQYRLRAKVLSISRAIAELPKLRRYRLVLIDESHNLRNREGKRYRAIQEYLRENESKVILLSAIPYNKTYIDLSNQLRLFVPEDTNVGIRPENLLRDLGETEFIRRYQCAVRSLAAFEKSEYANDWRELMRLYLVRRTRSFIQENDAETDPRTGRKYLTFADGARSYFPTRVPQTLTFTINDKDPHDQYALLYSALIVDTINKLTLPRYGLGNYVKSARNSGCDPPAGFIDKLLNLGKGAVVPMVVEKEHLIEPHTGTDKGPPASQPFGGAGFEVTGLHNALKEQRDRLAPIGIEVALSRGGGEGQLRGREQPAAVLGTDRHQVGPAKGRIAQQKFCNRELVRGQGLLQHGAFSHRGGTPAGQEGHGCGKDQALEHQTIALHPAAIPTLGPRRLEVHIAQAGGDPALLAVAGRPEGPLGLVQASINRRRLGLIGTRLHLKQNLLAQGLHLRFRLRQRGGQPSFNRPAMGDPDQPQGLAQRGGFDQQRAQFLGLEGAQHHRHNGQKQKGSAREGRGGARVGVWAAVPHRIL
ncbi:MAG TPA: hypothetical protein VNN62_20295 [Methylomirabilota bacterium]|nr:hypothetical protein [Methylomirabilota bacterium]